MTDHNSENISIKEELEKTISLNIKDETLEDKNNQLINGVLPDDESRKHQTSEFEEGKNTHRKDNDILHVLNNKKLPQTSGKSLNYSVLGYFSVLLPSLLYFVKLRE